MILCQCAVEPRITVYRAGGFKSTWSISMASWTLVRNVISWLSESCGTFLIDDNFVNPFKYGLIGVYFFSIVWCDWSMIESSYFLCWGSQIERWLPDGHCDLVVDLKCVVSRICFYTSKPRQLFLWRFLGNGKFCIYLLEIKLCQMLCFFRRISSITPVTS